MPRWTETYAAADGNAVGPRTWSAVIPGPPVAKGRPRFGGVNRRTGKPLVRTPEKTVRWETDAAWLFREQWDREPLDVPVELAVVVLFKRPQRLTWKTRPMPRCRHVARPDASNVLKAVEDALQNAGVVRDDATFFRVSVEKWYAAGDESPAVSVAMRWVEESLR